MKTIKIWDSGLSERQLSEICRDLEAGQLMVMPTDTVYAIVCDALSPKAIERVCRIKRINPDKTNLSIICSDISMASEYARIENYAFRLLRDNTPGPFTFLMRSASTLPKAFKGRKTVGIRIPDYAPAREIAERLGHPLLTTSIEFEDEDYAREPSLISETYDSQVDIMLEGPDGGTEFSTIVDCTGSSHEILREGKGDLR